MNSLKRQLGGFRASDTDAEDERPRCVSFRCSLTDAFAYPLGVRRKSQRPFTEALSRTRQPLVTIWPGSCGSRCQSSGSRRSRRRMNRTRFNLCAGNSRTRASSTRSSCELRSRSCYGSTVDEIRLQTEGRRLCIHCREVGECIVLLANLKRSAPTKPLVEELGAGACLFAQRHVAAKTHTAKCCNLKPSRFLIGEAARDLRCWALLLDSGVMTLPDDAPVFSSANGARRRPSQSGAGIASSSR